MHRFGWLTPLVVVFYVTSDAHADWPQFRGVGGQGIAQVTRLPAHWNANEGVAWKVKLPGQGWSSPVLSSGKIYLTTATPTSDDAGESGHSLWLLCLDASHGGLLWETRVFVQEPDAPKIHSKNSHASPTPIVANDAVYVHFGHQGTARLDLDGKIVWRNRAIQYQPVHGNGGTPVIHQNLLIFSVDGSRMAMVVALDTETGDEIWRFDRQSTSRKRFSFSTPALIDVQGRAQVVSPGSDVVHALEPQSGQMIWKVRFEGYSVIPKPVFDGERVYICTGYDRASLMAIKPDGSGDVTDTHVVWQTDTSVPKTPSLLLHGDNLFMVSDSGIASCLKTATGKLVWRERLGGGFSASPISALNRIYFTNEEGKTTVIEASDKFKVLFENSLNERSLASLAAVEGSIYLRTARHLFCLRAP